MEARSMCHYRSVPSACVLAVSPNVLQRGHAPDSGPSMLPLPGLGPQALRHRSAPSGRRWMHKPVFARQMCGHNSPQQGVVTTPCVLQTKYVVTTSVSPQSMWSEPVSHQNICGHNPLLAAQKCGHILCAHPSLHHIKMWSQPAVCRREMWS